MLKQFVDRPVLSTVISILIVIMGVIGYYVLPVTQYPSIAPPTVVVSVNYPGANAETLVKSVIVPIEEQINGVEGMTYIKSTASSNGKATITVFFEQSFDPDVAVVNVQNRVAIANSVLPAEVLKYGVVTQKQENSPLMYTSIYSTNPEYDRTFLENYFNIKMRPELQRIRGVSNVGTSGASKDYTMRIWLHPDKMSLYGVTPADIKSVINGYSLEAAPGILGQNVGEPHEYVIKYGGKYSDVAQYESMAIRSLPNGDILKLSDVADIELDAFTYSGTAISNGNPSINFGVYQLPGANAQKVLEEIEASLDKMKEDFPEGVDYMVNYNVNRFLNASLKKVNSTLFEAFFLVFVVVFLFLQDFKTTLIPAIVIPVSLIGTFFFLNILGYSINLLTIFALILAIGIVVDDAIIVVEAVHTKLEMGSKNIRTATVTAMSEISGAIISTTAIMVAVFIPITFMSGPAGVFYKQFGYTLVIAVLISSVNSLTLSPALSVLLLKVKDSDGTKKSFFDLLYRGWNAAFDAIISKYTVALRRIVRYKWLAFLVVVGSIFTIYFVNKNLSTGFVPTEDQGSIYVNIELPAGSSVDRTHHVLEQLYGILDKTDGVRTVTLMSGKSFFAGAGSCYGMGFINLDDWSLRSNDTLSEHSIINKLFKASAAIPEAKIVFFAPPSIRGFGKSNGVEAQLLDKSHGKYEDFNMVSNQFMSELRKRPEIGFVSNSFNVDFPQYELVIDEPKVRQAGMMVSDIVHAMEGFVGGVYINNFNKYGRQYKVMMQTTPEERKNIASLSGYFVRTSSGEMAPITEFVSLEKRYGAQTINRFNLYTTATLNATAASGYSSGDAIKAFNEVSDQVLNSDYEIQYSGITREEIAASGQSIIIFALSILFVYLLLSIQYESYILPLSVLFSIPIGVAGAYCSVKIAGLESNIYFYIALIVLIGLLAKNAILIVEFALQYRKEGGSLVESAIEGARTRFRPIMMTAFSFIFGLLPLVVGSGVGAMGNRSIGTGAAGGLLVGTLIGPFIIPILFIVFQGLHEWISGETITETDKTIKETVPLQCTSEDIN